MNRAVCLLIGMLLIIPCIGGCRGDSGRPVDKRAVERPAAEPAAEKKPWPYLGKEGGKDEVAEHLTAKNYVVIFDGSGSMAETKCAGGRRKYEVARDAFMEWAKSVPPDANVGLVAFHNNGWSEIPLGAFDSNRFFDVINRIIPGDTTPLTKAATRAHDMLTPQARRQLGYGEYHIVVVTDGIANDPRRLFKTVNTILARTPIIIHTIGFCIGDKHSLNQPGRTYYRTAMDPASLRKGLQDVLAEAETFDVTDFGN
ncbi:MAG: VWA domain-containing protein [Desulfomonilaceae bacterium]|nr:VWA domain-containing protein [Desulfomonilaceae bacterium]